MTRRETDSRCSTLSAQAAESMTGTAPHAVGWVALEQDGPWGAKAFTASHLDAATGAEIEQKSAQHLLRPCLIRRPGRHADAGGAAERTVLVSHGVPGRSWLLRGTVADPAELLNLDWEAIHDGNREAVQRSLPSLVEETVSHLLVCTNGTRDLCCALEGRPVADGVGLRHPGRVWETTHTSGHRFAATAVVLPSGHLHGRLSVDSALDVLAAADRGETLLDFARGRSCWPAEGQAAECAVRELTGDLRLDAVAVTSLDLVDGGSSEAIVRHADGREWLAHIRRSPGAARRPESCGRDAVNMSEITVEVSEKSSSPG